MKITLEEVNCCYSGDDEEEEGQCDGKAKFQRDGVGGVDAVGW